MQSVVAGLCAISGGGACTDAERRAAVALALGTVDSLDAELSARAPAGSRPA